MVDLNLWVTRLFFEGYIDFIALLLFGKKYKDSNTIKIS